MSASAAVRLLTLAYGPRRRVVIAFSASRPRRDHGVSPPIKLVYATRRPVVGLLHLNTPPGNDRRYCGIGIRLRHSLFDDRYAEGTNERTDARPLYITLSARRGQLYNLSRCYAIRDHHYDHSICKALEFYSSLYMAHQAQRVERWTCD